MTPAARIQAAIEVLDEIRAGTPAEQALTGWARRSRFAGSKDRAAVRDHVFQALRCRRSFACLGGAETGRGLMIGALRAENLDPGDIFTGAGYAPAPLSPEEAEAGHVPREEADRLDVPDWLLPVFRDSLGEKSEETALALRKRAPVMLRVNLRKASREEAQQRLAKDGVVTDPHPIAATALKVTEGTRRVSGSTAYQDGMVELQDGSSQAAVEALELPSKGKVLDFCAGGGGKTLAMAARSDAQWFAHDALPHRMADLQHRAGRAGIAVQQLSNPNERAPFDLVLCDVPCSGSGTWRRTPDAKWRFTADRLTELTRTQDEVLDRAAELVSATGVLAYSTCSVFREENEDRVAAFVQRSPAWQLVSQRRWPVSDGGDGFFLAHLARVLG